MRAPHPIHILWLLFVCMAMYGLAGCDKKGRLPIGSVEESNKKLQPSNNEFESGKLDAALRYVDSAFKSRTDYTVYDYLSYYGTHSYVHGGDLNKAIRYQDSIITLLEDYKHIPELRDAQAGMYLSRGEGKFNLRKLDAAYEDFAAAINMIKNSTSFCRKMEVPYSLAMILYRQQHFENSARYFKECLPFIDGCYTQEAYSNNKKQEVLDNIGLCYTKLKKYDSAMMYYRQALAIVAPNKFKLAIDSGNSMSRHAAASGVITGNMAKVFLGTGQVDSAIYYYKRAIDFNAGIGHEKHDMLLCLVQLSDIYVSQNAIGSLSQNLQQIRSALDSMPSPDVQIDYERLMYIYHEKVNNPAQALRYLTSYLHKKDSVAAHQKLMVESDISQELKDKQQQLQIELLQKTNQLNKTYLWVLVVFSALIIVILVLIYRFYNASRKNIKHLIALNKEIEAANTEKDRILRVVAHDLRNPIGGIATLSDMMLTGKMVNEEATTYMKAIASASGSAIGLIQELLNTGKPVTTSEEKVQMDMRNLVQQAVSLSRVKASEKKQRIEQDLPDEPVLVKTYPRAVERVLNNLLANAIKFSGEGAVTHIKLELHTLDVLIVIRDEGIGISPDDIIKIFNRFSTVQRTGTAGEQSFGLGLSICRQIVENIGGRIWAESEVGEGSVFYVSLPLG